MGKEQVVSLYALAVLPQGWNFGMPLPFSKAAHDLWKDRLEAGTRLVFYDPTRQAITGEGEVHGIFIQPKEWPATSTDDLPPSIASAEYVLPVRVLYQRDALALIPLAEVRRALEDDSFPQSSEEVRELDSGAYQLLTQNWP
jgi:hypothetical protein